MIRNSFIGVVLLGAFLVVFAGISHAGGMMHQSSGDEKPVGEAMVPASPQFGTWEYWLAEETGTLPGPEARSGPAEQAAEPASPQFGTWEYWLGGGNGALPESGLEQPLVGDCRETGLVNDRSGAANRNRVVRIPAGERINAALRAGIFCLPFPGYYPGRITNKL